MKKLMVAVAAAMLGIAVNAAAVTWSASEILINGDAGEWTGTFAPSGWSVYVFDSSITGYAAMQTAMTAAATDTTSFEALLATASASPVTTGDNGSFIANGSSTVTGTLTGYAVILDAASLAQAQWAFLVEENSKAVGSVGTQLVLSNTEGGWDPGYIGATGYGSAGNGWYAIPEPTSGLLLVVGGALLALRRRRLA